MASMYEYSDKPQINPSQHPHKKTLVNIHPFLQHYLRRCSTALVSTSSGQGSFAKVCQ